MPRREKLFLILASIFLCSLIIANIIGIAKFFEFQVPFWGYTVMVPIGILPYPVTFLATDLVCELYGRRRANWLVFVGFIMNLFLLGVMWLGKRLTLSSIWAESQSEAWHVDVFPYLWELNYKAVFASMVAYLVAQFVDVQLFHFWKALTKGKHLWLRNNASTMASQLIDSTIIISIVFGMQAAAGELRAPGPFSEVELVGYAALTVFIFNSYLFKLVFAALDTPFAYLFKGLLKPLVGDLDEGERRYDVD